MPGKDANGLHRGGSHGGAAIAALPDPAKRSIRALSAARDGDHAACRYLFCRFCEELYAELVSRGVSTEVAAARVIANFAAIPYERDAEIAFARDAEFDAWLAGRVLASLNSE